MTDVSRRFEQLIITSYYQMANVGQLLPIKTKNGILVGDVLIQSHQNLKTLAKKDMIIYTEVSLNEVAIRLANLLAADKDSGYCDRLYVADQLYGQQFAEWQCLKKQCIKAEKQQQYYRADILLAKYQESKHRAELAKRAVTLMLA